MLCSACRERNRKRSTTNSILKRKFGITLLQYEELLELQNGVCAICQQPDGMGWSLAVDHDHTTGQVRGLLCGRCNYRLLGSVNDDIQLLERAIAYLKEATT